MKRLEGAKKKQTRMEGEDVAMEAEEESQAASHYSTASALATQLLLVPVSRIQLNRWRCVMAVPTVRR